MRLLKYASLHFNDKEIVRVSKNEGGGKFTFYFADEYGSWIIASLREINVSVPRDALTDNLKFKAWLDTHWDEFEIKSVEVLKIREEKEDHYPLRKYLPRE
jgi:hypothetical protein